MEVALTFGSLGDIIAVCQLAIQLGRAIGSSQYGSVKEYQRLRKDLDVFVRVLMQVVATYPQNEFTTYLDELDVVTKQVVDECAGLIQATLERLQKKYHQAFSPDGSGNVFKDAGRKVQWWSGERERVSELHAKLDRGIQRITLLNALAVRKSARADNVTMLARVDEIKQLVSRNDDVQQTMLRLSQDQNTQLHVLSERMKKHEESMAERVQKQDETTSTILSQIKSGFHVLFEVKDMLHQVCTTVVDIRGLLLSQTITRSLNPTKSLPLVIEDALGNIIELPMGLVHSWEAFRFLLAHQFENKKGHKQVLQGSYALEEACTNTDVDTSLPLTASVRAGMKINMSMVFEIQIDNLVQPRCPRCGTSSGQENVLVQCTNEDCRMWFRIMPPKLPPVIDSRRGPPVDEFERRLRGEIPERERQENLSGDASYFGRPSDFQRVRIIPDQSTINSTRRSKAGFRRMDWILNHDIDGNEYMIPRGFRLSSDLGDFLDWHAKHVIGSHRETTNSAHKDVSWRMPTMPGRFSETNLDQCITPHVPELEVHDEFMDSNSLLQTVHDTIDELYEQM